MIKRFEYLSLILVFAVCSAFTHKGGKQTNKQILGQWEYVKATVNIEPKDVELEGKLTTVMSKMYEPHSFEFMEDDNYMYHTAEGSTNGKYLVLKNKIIFNEKSVDYTVDRFINESSDIVITKNTMTISSSQSGESIKEVNLLFGSDLKSIRVNVEYSRYLPKK